MIVNPLHSVLTGMAVRATRAAVAAGPAVHVKAAKSAPAVTGGPVAGLVDGASRGRAAPAAFRSVPGVTLTGEVVQMKITAHGYSANAAVLLTQGEQLGSIIDIIA